LTELKIAIKMSANSKGGNMPAKEDVVEVIKQCFDPEIPVNIWDLGLIYDIDCKSDKDAVKIRMTLTTQNCPSAKQIPDMVKDKIMTELKVKKVDVEVVFEPLWSPKRMSEEAKRKLGISEEMAE